MTWPFWILGIAAPTGAFSIAIRIHPPPLAESWRRLPQRAPWRWGYIAAALVIVIFTAQAVADLSTNLTGPRLQAAIALSLFALGMGYMFWHGFKHGAVVLTNDALFIYPATVSWRDVRAVETDRWGVRIQTNPGAARPAGTLHILRAFYDISPADLELMQTLRSRAA